MSNPTENPAPTTVIPESPETEEAAVEVVEKRSRLSRAKALIKTNKAPIIGWTLLAGAMGVGAAIGRATAPSHDSTEPLYLEIPEDYVAGEVIEVSDETVA